MGAEPFVVVGRIVKTHGLSGEVSVAPVAETSLLSLTGTEVWFVPPSAGVRTSRISGVRPGPKGPLVTLLGITSVDIARQICGAQILARTSDIPFDWVTPSEAEDDFVDFVITDARHGLIGHVVETIVTGANDVWVVEGPFGEVLIPVIDDVVLDVDDDARSIEVALLDGLLPHGDDEL